MQRFSGWRVVKPKSGGVEPRTIEVSEETHKKLIAFRKIFDVVTGGKCSDMEYAAIVIKTGLDEMPRRSLPQDERLRTTVVRLFGENPELVCEFWARFLEREGERCERR